MAATKGKTPPKKPQDRKPKATKPAAPVGRKAVLVVDGVKYHLVEADMTPLDVLALRRSTGFSLLQVFQLLQTAPDIDVLAIVLWLSRRSNGEPDLTFDEVATSFNYKSDFEVVNDDEGEAAPEA